MLWVFVGRFGCPALIVFAPCVLPHLFFSLSFFQVVVFDVTSDFMETFLSTYWMLFSEGAAAKGERSIVLFSRFRFSFFILFLPLSFFDFSLLASFSFPVFIFLFFDLPSRFFFRLPFCSRFPLLFFAPFHSVRFLAYTIAYRPKFRSCFSCSFFGLGFGFDVVFVVVVILVFGSVSFSCADDGALGFPNVNDGSDSSRIIEAGDGEEEEGSTSSPEVNEPKLLEWAEGATPLKGLHEGGWRFHPPLFFSRVYTVMYTACPSFEPRVDSPHYLTC